MTSPSQNPTPVGRRVAILLTALLGVAAVAVVRYYSRIPLALSLFFLVPIAATTWTIGRWAGLLTSVVSATAWLVAEAAHDHGNLGLAALNEAFRGAVFLVVTLVTASLKDALGREKMLAKTDFLTGLPNRRAFYERATHELERARRYHRPFTIVYLDLDDFKTVNDTQGHETGDELLRRVAETLKATLRSVDIVARFGGDEFVLLLPETGAAPAPVIVGRVNQRLLEAVGGLRQQTTVSIGVVIVEKAPDDLDAVIRQADHLMYQAKHAGDSKIRREVLR